jgi:hypothetical protein
MGANGKENKENDFTPLELELMEKMTPQHKALMHKLNKKERQSMAQNVKPEYVDLIQSWIGTDEEIEGMLFWDKGGKYDDPEWQGLKPVDEQTSQLFDLADAHLRELKKEAVEIQRRSDLTLYSQFNTSLLFTGISGAVRCNAEGEEDGKGDFFKGVELRCIGSVEENINSITIYPLDSDRFQVHFGSRKSNEPRGIWAYTGDSHSLLQLAQTSEKVLPKHGFETMTKNTKDEPLQLDPKEIRKSAMGEGEKIDFGGELKLFASQTVSGSDNALTTADNLSHRFYERFGLETECYKIGKKYGNFFIMREENFDHFLPETPAKDKGLILLTATLVCRRCRREMDEFRDLAKNYPDVKAALVNLSSPQFKFYEKVFGDMGGGDVDNFRKNAAGVTPFVIVYSADENGVLKFREYLSTAKADKTLSIRDNMEKVVKYFK